MRRIVLTLLILGVLLPRSVHSQEKEANLELPNGFVIEKLHCSFENPNRRATKLFGMRYPEDIPYGERIFILANLELQGYWKEGADKSKSSIDFKIELEAVPLGLEGSPELLKGLREKNKFDWEVWRIDDEVEKIKDESEKSENDDEEDPEGDTNEASQFKGATLSQSGLKLTEQEKAEDDSAEGKRELKRFELPTETDFFGSPKQTRGGFRYQELTVKLRIPKKDRVPFRVPITYEWTPKKPPIACCYYRVGVSKPTIARNVHAGAFYHTSGVAATAKAMGINFWDITSWFDTAEQKAEAKKWAVKKPQNQPQSPQ